MAVHRRRVRGRAVIRRRDRGRGGPQADQISGTAPKAISAGKVIRGAIEAPPGA